MKLANVTVPAKVAAKAVKKEMPNTVAHIAQQAAKVLPKGAKHIAHA